MDLLKRVEEIESKDSFQRATNNSPAPYANDNRSGPSLIDYDRSKNQGQVRNVQRYNSPSQRRNYRPRRYYRRRDDSSDDEEPRNPLPRNPSYSLDMDPRR